MFFLILFRNSPAPAPLLYIGRFLTSFIIPRRVRFSSCLSPMSSKIAAKVCAIARRLIAQSRYLVSIDQAKHLTNRPLARERRTMKSSAMDFGPSRPDQYASLQRGQRLKSEALCCLVTQGCATIHSTSVIIGPHLAQACAEKDNHAYNFPCLDTVQ